MAVNNKKAWLAIAMVCTSFWEIVDSSIRHRRVIPLVFPRTAPTRIQIIFGIGIPLEDLPYGAMTTGYVFKAQYFLPYSVEVARNRTTTNIAGRRRRFLSNFNEQNDRTRRRSMDRENFWENLEKIVPSSKRVLSSYRWSAYKGLEGLAERLGLAGRSCVLKSICENAEVSYHYKNGIMGELMHLLLTPSTSADDISTHSDNEYFQAENYGRSGASCQRIFYNCQISLLEHFSNVYLLGEDLSMVFGSKMN